MRVTKVRAAVGLVASLLLIGVVGADVASASHAVTSVSPATLSQGTSSVTVTINGTGFSGSVNATVSGSGVNLTNVTFVSSTKITATASVTNGAATGARDVTVTQGLVTDPPATCTGCLTITQGPAITSLTPTGAANTGVASVGANGSGFQAGATLLLRRSGQADVVVPSPAVGGGGTTISGTVDLTGRAPGRWAVVVTNPDLGSATFGDGSTTGYLVTSLAPTFLAAPNGVTPASVGANQTKQLTLTGTSFARGATITASGSGITVVPNSATYQSPTSYTVSVQIAADTATPAVVGAHDIVLTNTDGAAATCTGCLTVVAAPTLASVAPTAQGQGASHQSLTLTGSGFVATPTVAFSGTLITVHSVVRVDATHLTVDVSVDPAAATGARDVTVVNPDGGTVTKTGGFTVNARPTVTSATPAVLGQGAPQTSVRIDGTNFVPNGPTNPTVQISGTGIDLGTVVFTAANNLAVPPTPAYLTVPVTVHADAPTGARDITVTNPDNGVGIGAGVFTVTGAPTITDVAPAVVGPDATSSRTVPVTVTGTGFSGTPTVAFSGSGVSVSGSVVRTGSTTLTFNALVAGGSTAVGQHEVTVTNPDGGTATTAGGSKHFTVDAPPTLTSANPSSIGQGAVAVDVAFDGSGGLVNGATATVSGSGVTVNSVTFDSANQLTVNLTVASGATTGVRNISVTNPDGGTATCTGCLTINTGPQVTSIAPAGGSTGTTVNITNLAGSNFSADPAHPPVVQLERNGQPSITMSGTTASSSKITGSFTLTNGGLAAAPGLWNVRVTNPDGGSAVLANGFNVTGSTPSISTVGPNSQPQGSTRSVVISGNNFNSGTVVSISDPKVVVGSQVVVNANQIDASFAAAADAVVGGDNVTVTNSDGSSSTCAGCLTITAAPVVSSLSPASLSQGVSSKTVVVTGTGFVATPTVSFSGSGVTVDAGGVTRNSATQLTLLVTVDPGADTTTARSITVTNPDGGTTTKASALTVDAAPTIGSANPASRGRGAANQTITLTGSGFKGTPTVVFSGTGISTGTVTRLSATQLTVVISVASDASTGARDITVSNNDSNYGSATLTSGFTVTTAPAATSLSPASRPQGSSAQTVTVTGTGFVATPTVSFSGTGVTVGSVTHDSATQLTITVTVAAGAAPTARDVTVTNPDAGTSTLVGGFTVAAAPSVTSVTPASRPQGASSQSLVLAGSSFVGTPTVTFSGAGITVDSVTRDSASQLTVVVSIAPSAATGQRNVTVTNPDGGAGTLTNGFTVNAVPTVSSLAPASRPQGASSQIITITGTGFVSPPTVTFSGAGITVGAITFKSSAQISATIAIAPSAPTGQRDVTVTNPDGGAGTLVGGFTVTSSVTTLTHDFSGDGCADLLAVTNGGQMLDYTGGCNSHFTGNGAALPGDWSGATQIVRTDWNHDGCDDVLVTVSNGDLYRLYSGCTGGFSGIITRIGSGWNSFARILTPGDFTGDGCADLLGVLGDGRLFLYRGDCNGGFLSGAGQLIGSSWNSFANILTPGDFSGDGCADLLGVLGDGRLFLYRGNCNSGFLNGAGQLIGSSWNSFQTVITVGDFSGDAKADLMGILPNGDLLLYRGDGNSGFLNGAGQLIGTSWAGFRLVV